MIIPEARWFGHFLQCLLHFCPLLTWPGSCPWSLGGGRNGVVGADGSMYIYIYYMKQVVYIHWEWNGMTWNMNTLGNVWCDVLRFWMFISRLQGAACHARPPVTWSSVEFRIWDLKKLRVELSWLQMFTRQSPNIAMEQNTIFDGIYKERPGFSVAVLVYRRVYFIRFVDFSQRLLQAVRTCWPVV